MTLSVIDSSTTELAKILLCSTQLAANYDMWKDNENIQNIMDINKNSYCKFVKNTHPYLDDLSVKCIVLSFYLTLYSKISSFVEK